MAKLTPEEKEELRYIKRRAELIDDASQSLEAYYKLAKQVTELEDNMNHFKAQELKATNDLIDAEKELERIKNGLVKVSAEELSKITKLKDEAEKTIKHAQDQYKYAEKEYELRKDALKLTKLQDAAWKSSLKGLKNIGKELLQQRGWLYEQQKAVKETELTMGILSKQASGFRKNIYKTSLTTQQLGVGSKELAAIQGTYSQTIGRSVQLSEEQLIAVAALAKGTTLGAEGAAEFAANMENFGISAKDSVVLVQDILNSSHSMGVNASKVIENVAKNMQLAQKYQWKQQLYSQMWIYEFLY